MDREDRLRAIAAGAFVVFIGTVILSLALLIAFIIVNITVDSDTVRLTMGAVILAVVFIGGAAAATFKIADSRYHREYATMLA